MAGANPELSSSQTNVPHSSAIATQHSAALEPGTSEYYSLQQAVFEAGKMFLVHGGRVVVLRCDGGRWISPLIQWACGNCQFIALDDTQESVEECIDRHKMCVHLGFVEAGQMDLNERFPETASVLTLGVESMSRLQDERRGEVLRSIRRHLERSGAFIMMERADRDWETELREAGFHGVRRIWRRGAFIAWLALR